MLSRSPRTVVGPALFLLLSLATGAGGCGPGEPPVAPDGFILSIQLQGIRAAAVDSIRLVVAPQVEATGTPRFGDIPPYDEGGVRMSVDVMGRLVIEISGDHVRTHGVPMGEGDLDPRIDLELWSDDTMMRVGPQIIGYAVIDSGQLGVASAYLPSWPLPLGEGATLPIPCMAGFELMCAPPP